MEFTFRPISAWPGKQSPSRKYTRFKASYSDTLKLLGRELTNLSAKNVVIQAWLDEREIRNDGQIRADARPRSPGVILSFDSKHGRLSYPCDTFTDWQGNLRAIALALEALRTVDRYGVVRRGEQYAGWKALPAPSRGPGDEFSNNGDAWSFLQKILPADQWRAFPGGSPIADVLRAAEMATHPDRGGNPDDFKRVQRCRELLIASIAQ